MQHHLIKYAIYIIGVIMWWVLYAYTLLRSFIISVKFVSEKLETRNMQSSLYRQIHGPSTHTFICTN